MWELTTTSTNWPNAFLGLTSIHIGDPMRSGWSYALPSIASAAWLRATAAGRRLRDISCKVVRTRSSDFLIDFRSSRNSGWLVQEQVESDPLHEGALNQAGGVARCSFTSHHSKRVVGTFA